MVDYLVKDSYSHYKTGLLESVSKKFWQLA